ncbi:MAG: HlyD family efflux transporter periplasmic adaptor subunit [Moorea sp. SIO2B7]|nr:HlyD family efflux transporter periplasmic adaptor subunit [Moorena sp. SIO2B7]
MISRILKIALPTVLVGIVVILTINILLPSFRDPNSRVYSSGFGYPALQRKRNQPIEVETASVEVTSYEDSIAAPGEAVPLEEIEIRPKIWGIVAEVYVTEGEQIQKGQPLVRIEQSDFQDPVNIARNNLQIAQAQFQLLNSSANARLEKLEQDAIENETQLREAEVKIKQFKDILAQPTKNNIKVFEREVEIARKRLEETKQLVNKVRTAQEAFSLARVILAQQIEKARLIVANSKLQLETTLRDLERTVISAPTDGLVSQVNIDVGELAHPGNRLPLLTISQNVTFKAYVDQARLNALHVGDRATVRLSAYPGRTFSGKVIKINPTVETAAIRRYKLGINRQYTYSVWVEIDNLELPPGVQGYAQFNLPQTSLTIPESAVTHLSAGEGMVMVLDSDRARVKRIKLGRKFDNQRKVLAGLEVGEEVLIHPRAINPGDLLSKST